MTSRISTVEQRIKILEIHEADLSDKKAKLRLELDRQLDIPIEGAIGPTGGRGMPGSEMKSTNIYLELQERAISVCNKIDQLNTDIANLTILVDIMERVLRYPIGNEKK